VGVQVDAGLPVQMLVYAAAVIGAERSTVALCCARVGVGVSQPVLGSDFVDGSATHAHGMSDSSRSPDRTNTNSPMTTLT
jgi:hypothetical protein